MKIRSSLYCALGFTVAVAASFAAAPPARADLYVIESTVPTIKAGSRLLADDKLDDPGRRLDPRGAPVRQDADYQGPLQRVGG